LVDAAIERKRSRGLFDLGPLPTPETQETEEYDRAYLLALEREALGFYVSGHPLDGLEHLIKRGSSCSIEQALTQEGAWLTLGGVFTFVEIKRSRKGEDWARATLEDKSGTIDCLFFARSYEGIKAGLAEDLLVFVKGKVNDQELIATELEVPSMRGK
jgi:DNA polymerase-3 subunit alpha